LWSPIPSNIGADLGAMSATLWLLIDGPMVICVAVCAIVTVLLDRMQLDAIVGIGTICLNEVRWVTRPPRAAKACG
jgi:hypothetical protein